MSSVNKVILIGNLGRDPEIRNTNSGSQVASFSIATSEIWRDKNSNERMEKTDWHNIVIFNENYVRFAEKYLKKGSKVYIEGQLQTRKWQDQSGQDRYTTEVVLKAYKGTLVSLDKVERSAPSEDDYGTTRPHNQVQNNVTQPADGQRFDDLDDNIPF